MKLIAYVIDGAALDIAPAALERGWMDATRERFAYRCLPLNIANAYGWEVRSPSGFKATWNGEEGIDAITIESEPGTRAPAVSHFGGGILTFHLPCLFRTEPSYDLMVVGPLNRPKDAIAALAGVIETDWAPYTFTMNWLFTQPEIEIEFERGEPFCQFFPVKRGELELFAPEIRPLSADPELDQRYRAWQKSRRDFNADLKVAGSSAQQAKWQKHYYRGSAIDLTALAPDDHRTRVRLKDFRKTSE